MKRIITIVIFTFFLLFTVSSFASSDAGSILKSWYKQKFDHQIEEFAGDFLTGSQEIKENTRMQKNDEMNGATDKLKDFSSGQLEQSAGAIGNYQKHYIKIANETVQDLSEKNFSSFEDKEAELLNAELDNEALEILKEILQ